jgi:hypothetical protein
MCVICVLCLIVVPLLSGKNPFAVKINNNNNNNSVEFFIIYMPSQQLQGQLQTQHSADTSNYIMDKQYIKSKANYRQVLKEKHINAEN